MLSVWVPSCEMLCGERGSWMPHSPDQTNRTNEFTDRALNSPHHACGFERSVKWQNVVYFGSILSQRDVKGKGTYCIFNHRKIKIEYTCVRLVWKILMPAWQCSNFKAKNRRHVCFTLYKHVPLFFFFFYRQFSQNLSLNWARASVALPTIKLATIKRAVSVVALAVSATQLEWRSRVTVFCSDWLPESVNGENRNCLWRVGVLANRKTGWVEGPGRLCAYTHTHTRTHTNRHTVVVKLWV